MTNNVENKINDVVEYDLPGEKLSSDNNNTNTIIEYGSKLYKDNELFIKEKIQPNWFAVIDPNSAKIIASSSQIKLYEHTKSNYPGKIFYFLGLIKNNLVILGE